MRLYAIGTDPDNPERRVLHQIVKNGKSTVFENRSNPNQPFKYPVPDPEEFREDVMRLARLYKVKQLKK